MYLKAISWFNHELNNTVIILSNKQIAFNNIPCLTQLTDYPRCRLPFFVIVLKQYIYACKYLDKKPNTQEFQRKAIIVNSTMANTEMRSSLHHRFYIETFL